jgi:hypothetical protein
MKIKKDMLFEDFIMNYYCAVNLNCHSTITKLFHLAKDTLFKMILGEIRHAPIRCEKITYTNLEDYDNSDYDDKAFRHKIYENASDFNPLSALQDAIKLFYNYEWYEDYGGHKWGKIAELNYEMFTCDYSNISKIIILLEKVIYLTHNSGLAFNKHKSGIAIFDRDWSMYLLDTFRDKDFIQALKSIAQNHWFCHIYNIDKPIYYELQKLIFDKRLPITLANFARPINLNYTPITYGAKLLIYKIDTSYDFYDDYDNIERENNYA